MSVSAEKINYGMTSKDKSHGKKYVMVILLCFSCHVLEVDSPCSSFSLFVWNRIPQIKFIFKVSLLQCNYVLSNIN